MHSNFPKKVMFLAASGGLAWLFLRYLFPIALPFGLAALVALAAQPLVRFLRDRLSFKQGLASGIGVGITLAITVLVVAVLGALMVRQLRSLVGVIPDLESVAQEGLDSLQSWLGSLSQHAPEQIRPMLNKATENLFADGSDLLGQFATKILQMATGFVARLPDGALTIGTWLLASFMFSSKLPAIRNWLQTKMPTVWMETYLPMLRRMRHAVSGWLTAQLKLIGITFSLLCIGFFLLRISYAPIWAILIALVDSLPVLGSGLILIPWALVSFLQSDTPRAMGMLAIYALVTLARVTLEPRLVGKQLGLDPLITLAAMYTGYRLWGIGGMLLAPLLTVVVSQFFTAPNEM